MDEKNELELLKEITEESYKNSEKIDSYTKKINKIEKDLREPYAKDLDRLIEITSTIDTVNLSNPQEVSRKQLEIASLVSKIAPYVAKWDSARDKIRNFVNTQIGISFSDVHRKLKQKTKAKMSDVKVERVLKGYFDKDVKLQTAIIKLYNEANRTIESANRILMVLHDLLNILENEAKGVY